jgi:hypothetical protein
MKKKSGHGKWSLELSVAKAQERGLGISLFFNVFLLLLHLEL